MEHLHLFKSWWILLIVLVDVNINVIVRFKFSLNKKYEHVFNSGVLLTKKNGITKSKGIFWLHLAKCKYDVIIICRHLSHSLTVIN